MSFEGETPRVSPIVLRNTINFDTDFLENNDEYNFQFRFVIIRYIVNMKSNLSLLY